MMKMLVILIQRKRMLYFMRFPGRRMFDFLIFPFTKLIIGMCFFSFCVHADEWRTNPINFEDNTSAFMGVKSTTVQTKLLSGGKPMLVNSSASPVYTYYDPSDSSRRSDILYWMKEYSSPTLSVKLEGKGPLNPRNVASPNKCYLIPAFYGVFRENHYVVSHASNTMNSNVGLYYMYSQSLLINDKCTSIDAADPRVSNPIIVTPPNFYLVWGNYRSLNTPNNLRVGRIFIMSTQRASNYISSSIVLYACPENKYSSMCTYFPSDRYGDPTGPTDPEIIPVSCDLQRSENFDFGTVTSDAYIGREKSIYLSVKCTGDASVKLSVVDANNLKLGPFKIEFLLNNSISPVVDIKKDISTDVVTKGKITGAVDEVTAGEYQGSMIIISELN